MQMCTGCGAEHSPGHKPGGKSVCEGCMAGSSLFVPFSLLFFKNFSILLCHYHTVSYIKSFFFFFIFSVVLSFCDLYTLELGFIFINSINNAAVNRVKCKSKKTKDVCVEDPNQMSTKSNA